MGLTKTMLKHHWRTVEYMYARGKGYARGACDLEHDGGLPRIGTLNIRCVKFSIHYMYELGSATEAN